MANKNVSTIKVLVGEDDEHMTVRQVTAQEIIWWLDGQNVKQLGNAKIIDEVKNENVQR